MPRIFRNGRDYSGSSAQIDDSATTAQNKTWSANKIKTELAKKADFSLISGLTIQTQYIDSTESFFVAYRIGELVFIKAKLKATNNIGNNYGLIYGLPIPSDVTFSLMPVFKDGRDFNNPTNVKNISAVVSNTGVLTLQTYPDTITSGEWLYINSMYISA